MTTYGRNGSFRASPTPQQRDGHCKTGNAVLPQFAPVVIASQDATDGRNVLALAAAAAAPNPNSGVLIWEEPWFAHAGFDPVMRTSADVDEVPVGSPAQRVLLNSAIKIQLQNTIDDSFDGMRDYDGKAMFNPTDAATLAIGDMVTPGAGNYTAGYWKKTATLSLAWGFVAEVDFDSDGIGVVVFNLINA